MTATKRLKETGHKPGWALVVDGKGRDTDWEVHSRYGLVRSAVVVDENGAPVYDRPLYYEAPNVNLVVFGKHQDGTIRIGILRQPRPHADDPEDRGSDDHEPIVFGQVPMGFAEKVFGESIENTAVRETFEETGSRVVLNVIRPECPWHNPNPTFVATWSDLLFVEVDLNTIDELRSSREEPIFSVEFLRPLELLANLRDGRDDSGALYRSCTSNSTLMIFFSTFPEYFPR